MMMMLKHDQEPYFWVKYVKVAINVRLKYVIKRRQFYQINLINLKILIKIKAISYPELEKVLMLSELGFAIYIQGGVNV